MWTQWGSQIVWKGFNWKKMFHSAFCHQADVWTGRDGGLLPLDGNGSPPSGDLALDQNWWKLSKSWNSECLSERPIWRLHSHTWSYSLKHGHGAYCNGRIFVSTFLEYFHSWGRARAGKNHLMSVSFGRISAFPPNLDPTRQDSTAPCNILSSASDCVLKSTDYYMGSCCCVSYMGDSTAVHLAPCTTTIPKPAGRPIAFHYHHLSFYQRRAHKRHYQSSSMESYSWIIDPCSSLQLVLAMPGFWELLEQKPVPYWCLV